MGAALQRQITRGQTSVQLDIGPLVGQWSMAPQVSLDNATTGLVIKYHRFGDQTSMVDGGISVAPVSIGALSQGHNPGGFKAIAGGCYRLDVPDAAFAKAVGINNVLISVAATGIVPEATLIQLVDGDRSPTPPTPQVY